MQPIARYPTGFPVGIYFLGWDPPTCSSLPGVEKKINLMLDYIVGFNRI
jgi:hypothetical protein